MSWTRKWFARALQLCGHASDTDHEVLQKQSMNIARRPSLLAVPLAFALLLATAALGQQPNGSVRGELSDSSGAVLPGVNVVATVNNHIFGSTVTDEKGAFVLEELPPRP